MKIYIIGLPGSGRTRVAKSLSEDSRLHYISATDWLRSTFRPPHAKESKEDYDIEYHNYYVGRVKQDQWVCVDNIFDIQSSVNSKHFVVDGVISPFDFMYCFDPKYDMVVFLNRTDTTSVPKDYEGVAVNVMRDYCLYNALMGILSRDRWLEYNYKIPGEEVDSLKSTGKHNSVFITKSINKAIEHLRGEVCTQLMTEEQKETE